MWIVILIFALLLLLFGGGCTLIMGGIMLSEPSYIPQELGQTLSIWIPFGLLPLLGGWLLIRLALNLRRKKREREPIK